MGNPGIDRRRPMPHRDIQAAIAYTDPRHVGQVCGSCGVWYDAVHTCYGRPGTGANSGPVPNTSTTVTIDYEKLALQEQVRGLVVYVAELRKHLHHHVGCLMAKNRYHRRETDEECDMCRAELNDCRRLLTYTYKSGTVAVKSTSNG